MPGRLALSLALVAAALVRPAAAPVLLRLVGRALLAALHLAHRRRRRLRLALLLRLGLRLELLLRHGPRCFAWHLRRPLRLRLTKLLGLTILLRLAIHISPLLALDWRRLLDFTHRRRRLAIALLPYCRRWRGGLRTIVFDARCAGHCRRVGHCPTVLAILGIRRASAVFHVPVVFRRGVRSIRAGVAATGFRLTAGRRRHVAPTFLACLRHAGCRLLEAFGRWPDLLPLRIAVRVVALG